MDRTAELTDEQVSATLGALKDRITRLLGRSLEKLLLFGSRARGDADPDSDVDVAIIVRGLDTETKERIFSAITDIELDLLVPVSALVLSDREFRSLVARERRIALDIQREGIPL